MLLRDELIDGWKDDWIGKSINDLYSYIEKEVLIDFHWIVCSSEGDISEFITLG